MALNNNKEEVDKENQESFTLLYAWGCKKFIISQYR